MTALPLVEVVAGIIVQDRRILLQQRPFGRDFAFTWESPGGKLETGETHVEAIKRELREELAIAVWGIFGDPLWVGEFTNIVTRPDRGHVRLSFLRIPRITGTPRPQEGQGVGWFTEHEVRALAMASALAPANARAVDVVCAAIRGAA